ncbi:hypothetical protein A1OK_04305 [Enterovibrio norvegicus FF-454]|uniref:Uncharacterized protein n=1 Tax=Enterovibrio norvegicus FF-454 TaxID=1185651 RepID=A0A1E5BYJ9_9GAMM|nr:hypothetical protein [Enterovibrio norvegicus]OEE58311.1 hypothetical protein A1OK_04305 [Enterovibrio norvegicus FF-454]
MTAKSVMKAAMILRDPAMVMNPHRLGAMHQTRISFVRSLLRKMANEGWCLSLQRWDLQEDGFGTAIYELATPEHIYQLVVFSDAIADDERIDRVIAEKWDVTFALIKGRVSQEGLEQLRQNVPLQEAGRNSPKVLVLSRANKSVRVFEHIVDTLANGEQPDSSVIASVGYILRTTAVYGNGKFGIADFETLQDNADFHLSFSAQMCAVYLLRQFSLDWVHFIAEKRGGQGAVTLSPGLQRYIGIGNATGLGMAPYLITHPRVVDKWLTQREVALATVLALPVDEMRVADVCRLLEKACKHLCQVETIDDNQRALNAQSVIELVDIIATINAKTNPKMQWESIYALAKSLSLETQEILLTCLLEVHPEQVNVFAEDMNCDQTLSLTPGVQIGAMMSLIETRYQWVMDIDFSQPDSQYWFWYRSVDKEEPRMAVRGEEPGEDNELNLDVARQVHRLYLALKESDQQASLARFLLNYPSLRTIARRVWTMGNLPMGDIQINVLSREVRPMHLLRCKLSMFGATKFDPRSDRWVRVTLFQGAPLFAELSTEDIEQSWLFPLLPEADANRENQP